jgi:hypothetical protein
MKNPRVIQLAAISVVFAILWIATWSIPFVSESFAAFAFVFVLATLWTAFVPGVKRLRRDPYDLGRLQEVHEREELSKLNEEVPDTLEFDSVVCRCCMSVYSNQLPTCPRCGGCG